MGKISTYTLDSNPDDNDYVPGVVAATGENARFNFGGVASLIAQSDWISIVDGLTYYSYDSTNKTVVWSTASDWSGKIGPGTRLRVVQSTGGTKYMIVVAITSTTITCYMGTDYSAASETVTNPVYSNMKAPLGFPLDPTKWTVSMSSANDRSTASGSWANLTDAITLGIGVWKVYGRIPMHTVVGATTGKGRVTWSSDASSETNPELTTFVINESSTSNNRAGGSMLFNNVLNLAAATTFTMLGTTSNGTLYVRGLNDQPTTFRAVCAYL